MTALLLSLLLTAEPTLTPDTLRDDEVFRGLIAERVRLDAERPTVTDGVRRLAVGSGIL